MPTRILAGARARALASPRYPRMLLIVTLAGLFSTSFPTTILSISVNDISANLNSAPSTITWVTTAPMLAGAVSTPVLGRLGDLRGHRRLFLAGLVTAGLFSLLTAAAWNATSLIAFRTVSQMGASAIVPATFAMLFRSFPPGERVRVSSLASGTFAGASVIGVIVGGPLIDSVGWRPIFIVQAIVALAALLPAAIVLRADDVGEGDRSVDYLGALALAVATFALTFGINRLGVWGPTPISVGSLMMAPVAVWVLIQVERRARSPLLPLRVLSARNIRVLCVSSFLLGSAWMGSLIVTPLLLQTVFALSAGMTSLVTVPRAASIMLVSPLAGRLGVRIGERRLLVGACVALAAMMGLMAVGAATTTLAIMVVALSLSGFAFGSGQPALTSAVGHGMRSEDFGLASSLQQTSNQIGSVVGIGLFTAIAADATEPGPYVVTYFVAIALCLGAAVVCRWVIDRHDDPLPKREELLPDSAKR
ncbi:MAG: putative efflux rane protein [Jatrophihabitantaceae bacterium]|nr:putative efflux rane protein [Jatrophihabitantaceae bacterium]